MTANASPLPRISVVVPSYNQGHFLRETFDSLFCQDYPNLEVVVMDGGSTDDSVGIIRAHAHRLKHWQSQKDGGQSAAINAGVQLCTGDLVTWLNSDDYYWRDCLWTVGRAYSEYPGYGLYIGNGFRLEQSSGRILPFCPRHIALNREALIQGGDYILQPSTFVLRKAWNDVSGLRPDLHFGMDWDLFIRIAARYPAVLINEFLAVSREYEETKTRSGNLTRALELVRMIQTHSHQGITPGTLNYLIDALLKTTCGRTHLDLKLPLCQASTAILKQLSHRFGLGNYFPEQSDPQERTYLPLASAIAGPMLESHALPSVTVILVALADAQWLEKALESILAQSYSDMEIIVAHADTAGDQKAISRRFGERVSWLKCEPASLASSAINRGLRSARGEAIAWIDCRDRLAGGALQAIGQSFAEAADADLVFGNAIFVDDQDAVALVDDGVQRSAFLHGEMKPGSAPPVVFFRRRLLERCGYLEESPLGHQHWLQRCSEVGKICKLEKTLILSRVCQARSGMPPLPAPLAAPRSEGRDGIAASSPAQRRYNSICCFLEWPHQLPQSKCEERDFHFLRGLLNVSQVECLVLHGDSKVGRPDALAARLETLHTPATLEVMRPGFAAANTRRQKISRRICRWLRRRGAPVLGPRYHLKATEELHRREIHCRTTLQDWLNQQPDFLFVSSQENPAAMMLDSAGRQTRLVLLAHDLEAMRQTRTASRITRLTRWLEARRALRYERDNLACYDAVIVASEHARQMLVMQYQFPEERIQVIPDGANQLEWDANLSRLEAFMARLAALRRRYDPPADPICQVFSARLGITRLSA